MKFETENRWHVVKQSLNRAAAGITAIVLAGTLMFGAVGCAQASGSASAGSSAEASKTLVLSESSSSTEASEASSTVAASTDIDESLYDLEYTDRDPDASYNESEASSIQLNGSSASVSGSGAEADGSTVTITEEGVYIISGTLDDGQIAVNAPEDAKVQLVLDGANITSTQGSAIYVQQADKCFITLADGSQNTVTDAAEYVFEGNETEPDAAIYSTCDLTLQGNGSLTVEGNYNDAVKTKDDLVITGGTYDITAKSDGLVGKDSVKIADGDITVKTTEGDGIKSSKSDDETKGFVSIDGGTIAIDAADKGVKAETYLRITGGTLSVTSGDDALHSNGSGRMCGGTAQLAAGDDAFHVEYTLSVDDGDIDVTKSVEGLEGQVVTLNGGNVHVVASDDGVNAAPAETTTSQDAATSEEEESSGETASVDNAEASAETAPSATGEQAPSEDAALSDGAAPSGAPDANDGAHNFGGGMGGMMDVDENCVITFNGGTLIVEADGDGIDSNGSIVLNGGLVLVSGPTNSGNGALDSGTTISANGGTLIAVGASGMAEGFTDGTQAFGQVTVNGNAGDTIAVTDSDGNVLASFTPAKAYQNAVVTVEGMQADQTYKVVVGGTISDADEYGYASSGTVSGGTETEFAASTEGSANAMGGFGGGMGGQRPDAQGNAESADGQGQGRGHGGFGGQRPDGAQVPDGGQRPNGPRGERQNTQNA